MPLFNITAEHTSGESVGHHCTTGVYSDPTDSFDEYIEAKNEEQAIKQAWKLLMDAVDSQGECNCKRREVAFAGSDSWCNSVSFNIESITRLHIQKCTETQELLITSPDIPCMILTGDTLAEALGYVAKWIQEEEREASDGE